MTAEKQVAPELDIQTIKAYSETFIPRTDMYPVQLPNGRYMSVKKPLTIGLVAAHLLGVGEITLGAYALSPESIAQWLCFDADDGTEWRQLLKLAGELSTQDVPVYIEPSRRGGHLWLFTPSLSGQDARRFGKQLVAEHGLAGIEFFPKQDQLVTGPGSLVRLPLGRHRLTGRRYHFISPTGEPLAPTIRQQIELLSHPHRVAQGFIDEIVQRAPQPSPLSPTPQFEPADEVQGETLSERIKNAISTFDFVSQYVELDQRGQGHCPFHNDRHKSFGVSVEGNYWNCFAGCGGGSVIDFWGKWREQHGQDSSFTVTITELAEMLF
jgi:hypothetical protein